MDMKEYLDQKIRDEIKKSKIETEQKNNSLKVLNQTDLANASYVVKIVSAWTGDSTYKGEKNTNFGEKGNIAEVIKKAEKEFMKINNRSDVEGSYKVGIRLGDITYYLPPSYWEKYTKRR
jgi:hypothetical protein